MRAQSPRELFAVSYGEDVVVEYQHYSDAVVDGSLARGWMPPFVPVSAREIREVHNIDTNRQSKNLARSKTFYIEKLGFRVDWGEEESASICQVSGHGRRIMLMENDRIGSPGCVWVGLESDRLFNEFQTSGVEVSQQPENKPWAYEMLIEEIDGNVLWLGTEPRE